MFRKSLAWSENICTPAQNIYCAAGAEKRSIFQSFPIKLALIATISNSRKVNYAKVFSRITGLRHIQCSNVKTSASIGGGNCRPGISRLYRLGVSQAQKAKESGDERPRLRASWRMPPTFLFLFSMFKRNPFFNFSQQYAVDQRHLRRCTRRPTRLG